MKERPILMSAPMVRAILDGTKTQTRRIVKIPASWDCFVCADWGGGWWPYKSDDGENPSFDNNEVPLNCPYGTAGDRLLVRETFYAYGRWETRFSAEKGRDEWHFIDMTLECGHQYQFDTANITPSIHKKRNGVTPSWWKRPAIFMPRAACRIYLEVTGVRVELLQDISEEDATAEGVDGTPINDARFEFRALWESINGADSWAANPWVWVVEFRRVKP
jgi:hypothetical protein